MHKVGLLFVSSGDAEFDRSKHRSMQVWTKGGIRASLYMQSQAIITSKLDVEVDWVSEVEGMSVSQSRVRALMLLQLELLVEELLPDFALRAFAFVKVFELLEDAFVERF
ncbi:hypothetical protein ACMFMF_004790 [Clarireedia jacksonii]